MHASSLENMQKCYERYVLGEFEDSRSQICVLDVGGANVNGTYADIFSESKYKYQVLDIAPGPGVDRVLDDPYRFDQEAETADLVISGQAFEHVEFFWALFQEMCRVVKKDGFIFLIAPSDGPVHRYPVDCYRFKPDAYAALAKFGGIRLIEVWMDTRGPWQDLVGVFSKTDYDRPRLDALRRRLADKFRMTRGTGAWSAMYRLSRRLFASGLNRYMAQAPVPRAAPRQDAEMEPIAGTLPSREVLRRIHSTFQPRFYLEIGVRTGLSLSLASCFSVGVDPDPRTASATLANAEIYRETSDFFFEESADEVLTGRPLDLAFIDGMHRFEFALRDFMQIEKRALSTSVIVIDDIYPNHLKQASRSRGTTVWAGDVWKLYLCLKNSRPDLRLFPLDAAPTGVLVVTGLNPRNLVLWESYNGLVRLYAQMDLMDYRALILGRAEAQSPIDNAALQECLLRLKQSRNIMSACDRQDS